MESSETVKLREALSNALKAICFTRDYVGDNLLPAREGWSWYDAGMEISQLIPDDPWVEEFEKRIQRCPQCHSVNCDEHFPECSVSHDSITVLEGFDVNPQNSNFIQG